MKRSRLARATAVALLVGAAAACAGTMRVHTTRARGASFAPLRTFALGGRSQVPEGFVRTPLTPEIERHVVASLVQELNARGYRQVEGVAGADIVVVGATGRRIRSDRYGGAGPRIDAALLDNEEEITEGTLVLDAFNGPCTRHLWHGQVIGAVERGVVRPEIVQRAVRQLLAEFPRAGSM